MNMHRLIQTKNIAICTENLIHFNTKLAENCIWDSASIANEYFPLECSMFNSLYGYAKLNQMFYIEIS